MFYLSTGTGTGINETTFNIVDMKFFAAVAGNKFNTTMYFLAGWVDRDESMQLPNNTFTVVGVNTFKVLKE